MVTTGLAHVAGDDSLAYEDACVVEVAEKTAAAAEVKAVDAVATAAAAD